MQNKNIQLDAALESVRKVFRSMKDEAPDYLWPEGYEDAIESLEKYLGPYHHCGAESYVWFLSENKLGIPERIFKISFLENENVDVHKTLAGLNLCEIANISNLNKINENVYAYLQTPIMPADQFPGACVGKTMPSRFINLKPKAIKVYDCHAGNWGFHFNDLKNLGWDVDFLWEASCSKDAKFLSEYTRLHEHLGFPPGRWLDFGQFSFMKKDEQ